MLSRWLFNALGYLLVFGDRFVVRHLLLPGFWTGLLPANLTPSQLRGIFGLYTIATGVLCWITASGLKRNKWWRLGAGIPACLLLLVGLPWLTIGGALGLYALLTAPAPTAIPGVPAKTKPTTDYWTAKRKSRAQGILQSFLWFGAFFLQAWFSLYAHRAGMPAWNPGAKWWLWVFLFIMVNTALHEAGHTIVAWALGYRVRIFSIGPVTYWRGRNASRFIIDWERLFNGGGYMGAVPVSDRNLRWNQTAVTAAGPATNFLICLISLDVFLALPGTSWQGWWGVPAVCAIVAGVLTIGNLIPLGYCDGTMLFHLMFNTAPGRQLLQNYRIHQMDDEADDCHDRADFQKEIELKEEMLRRALAFGTGNALMIAACHQALGSSYVAIDEWAMGEFHYRKSLEFEAEVAALPALAANLWCGIELTSVRRHDATEARRAYTTAAALLGSQKQIGQDANGPAMTFTMLAQSHERAAAFEQALAAVERGLKVLPVTAGSLLLRAQLLRCRALCHLSANDVEGGLAAAQDAAEILRSRVVPEGSRNLAWEHLADLGAELWRTGLTAAGIEYLREGIQQLEAGGASFVAARFRIRLASILRQQRRLEEAAAVLPAEDQIPPELRRAFLEARTELRLAGGRPDLAAPDAHELVELWERYPAPAGPEIAAAQALLAKVLLAQGDTGAAEALAASAAEVLGPRQHPSAASCAVTVALAGSVTMPGEQQHRVAAGMGLIDAAALLGPAEKARLKESELARVRQMAAAAAV